MSFSWTPAGRRKSVPLRVEQCEDRVTPSWGSIPPSTITVPATATAVTLNASGDATTTASISSNEIDFYKFTVASGSTVLSALTPNSNMDTVLGVFDATGKRVAFNDDLSSTNRDSRATVVLAAGTYFLGITNYNLSAGGAYTWSINGPTPVGDDQFENNDSLATASNLGTITTARTVGNLILADVGDNFKFTLTTAGTTGKASIAFNNAQGNLDLQLFNSAGTRVGSSNGTGDTETISFDSLPVGTYTVRVTGSANPNYTLNITPPVPPPPPPPPPGSFTIQVRLTGGTPSQRAVFQQAADRWAQVIVADLPDTTFNGVPVDDLLIDASLNFIDGPGGILGGAAPDAFRPGSLLPIHGFMQFDTADLAQQEASGKLLALVLHEMGHVLGIGSIWQEKGLLQGAGSAAPRFTGANAIREYRAYFNNTATSVPVEGNSAGPGSADSHFRESVFGNELMTPFESPGVEPLSRVTIGSLQDIGYTVDYSVADNYVPGIPRVAGGSSGGSGSGGFNRVAGASTDLLAVGPRIDAAPETTTAKLPTAGRRPPRPETTASTVATTAPRATESDSDRTTYTPTTIGGLFTFDDEM